MKSTVYLETSVVSYLAAQPSRDLLTAAHQQITHLWWRTRRSGFGLFVSQLVIDECMAGDVGAAERRLALLAELSLLDVGPEVTDLARHLATSVPLPPRAAADAFHIAIAARHGIDFLLTWNCAHIANAELRPRIERACVARGYAPPILCTPEELIGGHTNDS
jgi:predicted nucleic acid-binding protein